jgi:hypothetical protein
VVKKRAVWAQPNASFSREFTGVEAPFPGVDVVLGEAFGFGLERGGVWRVIGHCKISCVLPKYNLIAPPP